MPPGDPVTRLAAPLPSAVPGPTALRLTLWPSGGPRPRGRACWTLTAMKLLRVALVGLCVMRKRMFL